MMHCKSSGKKYRKSLAMGRRKGYQRKKQMMEVGIPGEILLRFIRACLRCTGKIQIVSDGFR